jgi:hypothetical protein
LRNRDRLDGKAVLRTAMISSRPTDAGERHGQIIGCSHSIRRGACRLPALAQHRRYEAVAPAWNVGDVALTGSTIAKRLAQRGDMNPQGPLVDHRIGPSMGD